MNTTFIEFLARNKVLKFGEFTLKSGRLSPYFINMRAVNTGAAMGELGRHYAAKTREAFGENFDVVFGPAYAAIPLAISTTIALNNLGLNRKWLFDRKEVKLHGADADALFVGNYDIDQGAKIVIVDDVFTTGGTKVEAISKLEKSLKAEVVGIVIAVNRMERGIKEGAIEEFVEETGVPVHSIVTVADIFGHLKVNPVDGNLLVTDKIYATYQEYMKKYGAAKSW